MAELARPSAKTIPTLVFTPPNPSAFFSRGTRPLAPDTTGASNALAMAGLAEELGKLPGGILDSYNKGQAVGLKTAQQEQAADFLGKRMASGDLSGLTVNSDGSHSWSSPKPATAQRGDLFNFLQGQHFDGKPEASGSMDLAPSQPIGAPLSRPVTNGDVPELDPNGGIIPITPNAAPNSGPVGKVTSYGYKSDPHGDTASLGTGKWKDKGPTGAWENRLSEDSIAISPDVEQQFKAAGIKEGDPVRLRLANGEVVTKKWDDRTMQDEQAIAKFGKPLRGRFDFFSPSGEVPIDGMEVVGFEPINASASVDPAMRDQISAAAENIGQQLTTNDLGDLQAANTPGPTGSADLAPVTPERKVANRVARVTVGRDPQTGAMIYAPTPTDVIAVTPTGDKLNISPAAGSQAAPKGMTFPNLEAVKAAGLDPEGAKLNPDGSFTVETFKAGGTDERGRGKITDAQKNKLVSSAELTQELNGMQEVHRQLYADNKAGPIMGRFNSMRNKLGIGDGEFVEANGTIKVANFKIARLLNGPGVLTDADIARAQEVAPTLNETPESFAAKMNAVKKSLRASVESWMAVNAGQATPEQEAAAQRALETLGGPAAAPSSGNLLIDAAKGKTQPGGAAQEILRDFQSGKFDNDPRKPAIEKKLREMGLLSEGSRPGGVVTAAIEG